jgi:hypothetical protein
MLFASEPGMGMTLTAWCETSPSLRRLTGRVNAGGTLTYTEARAPDHVHRIELNITFENDDRWTAELRDAGAAGRPIVAAYTFTRS